MLQVFCYVWRNFLWNTKIMFSNGADRKQWVMAMVQVSAEAVKYNVNMTEIGQLIDDLCKMSKVVNGDKKEEGAEQ